MSFLYEDNVSQLNDNFYSVAKEAFGEEADQKHFDTKLLKNPSARIQLLEEENAQKIELTTTDGVAINGYFIDRGADKALLIGQGFLVSCDKMLPFVKIFPDYDLLIINYRWHNWHSSLTLPSGILSAPLHKYIYEAKNDVIAAVKFLRNHKPYETVTGIGLCYSGLVYVIAQAMVFSQESEELLFDKLIIDSSYYSTQEVANSVLKDPKLCCENKHGGTPNCLQALLSAEPISNVMKLMGDTFMGEQFEQLSMAWYLPMIAFTPIMFIHGKNDLLVPIRHFEKMYKAAYNTPHCALVTEHEHTLNHFKAKEAYAYLGKMFIESSSMKDFTNFVSKNFDHSLN